MYCVVNMDRQTQTETETETERKTGRHGHTDRMINKKKKREKKMYI